MVHRADTNFLRNHKNNLAGYLLQAPGKSRDPHRALRIAQEASQLDPKFSAAWLTMGQAHYRLGSYGAAIAAFNKGILTKDITSYDRIEAWMFLAMAHHSVGDPYLPILYLASAQQAIIAGSYKPLELEDLERYRNEAAHVIGVAISPKPEQPMKVDDS